uniref:protein-ribulosamine 3-kinase n=1 Tax=Serinus canaria TaxID=9135 RepID=A0A8C9KXQ3_SERCA
NLHLQNQQLREKMKKEESTVAQRLCDPQKVYLKMKENCLFCGVEVTSAVLVLQVNNWRSDWMDLIERSSGDRESRELWAQLQEQIPSFFCGVEIVHSLLHGDLWRENVAEDDSGPIIFDPASFCHSEHDFAIAGMFGGFSSSFYSAYHSKIPGAAGFEKHLKIYQLFHYMNHWNHFGSVYGGSSVNIMRKLTK